MRGERIKAKGDGLLRWKTTPAALGFEPNRKARLHFRSDGMSFALSLFLEQRGKFTLRSLTVERHNDSREV